MSDRVLRVAFVGGWSPQRAPGIARYATQLLAALRRGASSHEITELRSPWVGAARVAWTQAVLPFRLLGARPDVCHLTAHPASAAWRGPTVLTLHDLSLIREPATHPRRRVLLMAPMLRVAARRASAVIVPSHATARDAERLLGLDPVRIHVIPEAPAAAFRPVTDPVVLGTLRRRHDLRPGYVLAVGTLEPRKNLALLVDAWVRLRLTGWDGQLVLAGPEGWGNDALRRRLADPSVAPHVRQLGYVTDEEMPALLSLAGAVAYPSLLEGFGLPVVEALACAVPTVTADRGATAEVAGDAALLVDPTDAPALAIALELALTAGPERDRLIARGPVRAATFTWDAAARETSRVYALAAELGR